MNLTPLFGHFNTVPLQQLAAYRDDLVAAYLHTRAATERLAAPLSSAQQSIQSMPDASPVKWHRAHTTWFFETFVLQKYEKNIFDWYDPEYCYLFNSYYNGIGKQYPRAQRGQMSKPGVTTVAAYRQAVDDRMTRLMTTASDKIFEDFAPLLLLGLNHEQQHQELICTDYQHAWCSNPGQSPPWPASRPPSAPAQLHWRTQAGGLVNTGYRGPGFSFDNERPAHRYWLETFELASRPVLNGEYLAFILDGGYENPLLWLADGWAWVQQNNIEQPLYWRCNGGDWQRISCFGLQALDPGQPVTNINFYEADAFAHWSSARLPTEHEWEHAMRAAGLDSLPATGTTPADNGIWPGPAWEWTASPYIAYPRFRQDEGAVGEYNGKFMSNQMVLRGSSSFTAPGHSRISYRNFFYPDARWQQTGLRLARDVRAGKTRA